MSLCSLRLLEARPRSACPGAAHCATNHHMFYVLTADLRGTNRADRAICGRPAFSRCFITCRCIPRHSPGRWPTNRSICRLRTNISGRLVRLPMFYDLTDREVAEVASAVLDFFRRREAP